MTKINGQTSKEIILASRPVGKVKKSDFQLREVPIPNPGPGEVLVRLLYLSIDPYMRGRMNAGKSYAPPFELGCVLGGGAVGEVIASKHKNLFPGDIVTGDMGWRSYAVVKAGALRKIDESLGPISYGVSVLGMPGMTAYFGLLELGKPKPGDTVFVSAAAGAVGSLVGQIAKISGCYVVGTVGSNDKKEYCLSELGFDRVINYRESENLIEQVLQACPRGIDINFENVGGVVGDAAMRNLAFRARVVVCGFVSEYNRANPYIGPSHLKDILVSRAIISGFLVTDWLQEWPQGIARMAYWLKNGKIAFKEDISNGLESAPQVMMDMLDGQNFGKALVKIAER